MGPHHLERVEALGAGDKAYLLTAYPHAQQQRSRDQRSDRRGARRLSRHRRRARDRDPARVRPPRRGRLPGTDSVIPHERSECRDLPSVIEAGTEYGEQIPTLARFCSLLRDDIGSPQVIDSPRGSSCSAIRSHTPCRRASRTRPCARLGSRRATRRWTSLAAALDATFARARARACGGQRHDPAQGSGRRPLREAHAAGRAGRRGEHLLARGAAARRRQHRRRRARSNACARCSAATSGLRASRCSAPEGRAAAVLAAAERWGDAARRDLQSAHAHAPNVSPTRFPSVPRAAASLEAALRDATLVVNSTPLGMRDDDASGSRSSCCPAALPCSTSCIAPARRRG